MKNEIKFCPFCGTAIDSFHESDSPTPFAAFDPMVGLSIYGPFSCQKEMKCKNKDYLHFKLQDENRLVKLGGIPKRQDPKTVHFHDFQINISEPGKFDFQIKHLDLIQDELDRTVQADSFEHAALVYAGIANFHSGYDLVMRDIRIAVKKESTIKHFMVSAQPDCKFIYEAKELTLANFEKKDDDELPF